MQYMRWMPTVFGVFFYQFPSGLVLYYTLNSIATFTELRIIKWRLGIPH
jgi:membrane protein insertase Oxa1/YidC/SpoIIIJ